MRLLIEYKPYKCRYTYIIQDNDGVKVLDFDGKDITKRVMNKPFYELLMAYKSLHDDRDFYKEMAERDEVNQLF